MALVSRALRPYAAGQTSSVCSLYSKCPAGHREAPGDRLGTQGAANGPQNPLLSQTGVEATEGFFFSCVGHIPILKPTFYKIRRCHE